MNFVSSTISFPSAQKRHSRPEHFDAGGNPYIYSSLDWRRPAAAAATAAGAAAAIAVIHVALCAADRCAAAACGWLAGGQGADRAEEDEEAGEGEGSSFIRKNKRVEKKISIVAAKA